MKRKADTEMSKVMAKVEREYRVWIKGRRLDTEERVTADCKVKAQIAFAARFGIKSFQTEAVWVRQ